MKWRVLNKNNTKRFIKKIERKNDICNNVFGYENKLTYPVYISEQAFERSMDLLLINDENKHHYVYNKDFNRFIFNKTKCKNQKLFCRYGLQCFSSDSVLMEHKAICREINDKQKVKLESSTVKFKNHFIQIAALFKIYADFEFILKSLQIIDRDKNTSYTEKYQDHVSYTFGYKFLCNDDKFSKSTILYRGGNSVNKLIEEILKEYEYCKKLMKKHFNKNLIMSVEDEEKFQASNKILMHNKLFTDEDEKERDHD